MLSFYKSSTCDSEGKGLLKATQQISNWKWHQTAPSCLHSSPSPNSLSVLGKGTGNCMARWKTAPYVIVSKCWKVSEHSWKRRSLREHFFRSLENLLKAGFPNSCQESVGCKWIFCDPCRILTQPQNGASHALSRGQNAPTCKKRTKIKRSLCLCTKINSKRILKTMSHFGILDKHLKMLSHI